MLNIGPGRRTLCSLNRIQPRWSTGRHPSAAPWGERHRHVDGTVLLILEISRRKTQCKRFYGRKYKRRSSLMGSSVADSQPPILRAVSSGTCLARRRMKRIACRGINSMTRFFEEPIAIRFDNDPPMNRDATVEWYLALSPRLLSRM